jgi:hypothetical protein
LCHLEVNAGRGGCVEVVEQMKVRHVAQKMDAMLLTDVARERVEVLKHTETSKDNYENLTSIPSTCISLFSTGKRPLPPGNNGWGLRGVVVVRSTVSW